MIKILKWNVASALNIRFISVIENIDSIYDDEKFFNQYEELRNEQKDKNANDLIEIPMNKDGYLVFSQEHPFTTCIKFTDNVKKGHTVIDNKYFGIFSDYNRPRREN